METTTMAPPKDSEQLLAKASDYRAKAQALAITDQATNVLASEFLKGIKLLQKKIEATFDPIVKKTRSAWQEATAQRDGHLRPLQEAEKILKPRIAQYLADQDRKRREEEARQIASAKAQEEAARLAEAEELERAGEHEAANEVLDAPMEAPVVSLPNAEKVEGISAPSYDYKYEITNKALIPDEYRIIDEKRIGTVVRATKGEVVIHGVRVYKVPRVSVRVHENGDA